MRNQRKHEKIDFVTIKISIGYRVACKRCPFALQKGVDEKTKGKEIYKNNPRNAASLSPSEGGDVPGGI